MTGVAGVMAVVLAEAVAGATALLWLTPLWSEVKRGFFTLVGSILSVLAIATWFSVEAGVVARFPNGDVLRWTTTVAAAATILSTLLLVLRRPSAARVAGLASVLPWAAALVWMGGAGRQALPLAPWIALGMIVATALIAVLVKAALRGERASAVQSATGFYYLAVVTAFTAEVAVKTRFLEEIRGPAAG